MPMDSIPSEIFRPIIEHLNHDRESLLAVSLASHLLRVEGQRMLFRTMDCPTNKETHIKFLTVIISSSLLAQHVKEFFQFGLLNPEHQQEPLWELTCRGLNAMVNLKHLVFSAFHDSPCAQILRGCTFRLEILKWGNFRDAEQLLEFLPTQTDLRILEVMLSSPELNTSDICPRLQVLHGDQGAMDAFLPGRTITSLKWSPDLEELRIDAPIYTPPQEFHHLRYFSFGGFCGRPPLSVVLGHLPVLEVLELIGLHFVEVGFNFSLLFVLLIKHTPRNLGGLPKSPYYGCSSLPTHRPLGDVCCHSRSAKDIFHKYLHSANLSSTLTLILIHEQHIKDGFEMAVLAIFLTSTRFFYLIGIYCRHSTLLIQANSSNKIPFTVICKAPCNCGPHEMNQKYNGLSTIFMLLYSLCLSRCRDDLTFSSLTWVDFGRRRIELRH
jgi:hypothetical protein